MFVAATDHSIALVLSAPVNSPMHGLRRLGRYSTGSMLGVSADDLADDKHCVTVDGKVVVGRRLHH